MMENYRTCMSFMKDEWKSLDVIRVSPFYMHPFLAVLIYTTGSQLLCSGCCQTWKRYISFTLNRSMLHAFKLGSVSLPIELFPFS